MKKNVFFTVDETIEYYSVSKQFIIKCIEHRWIVPCETEKLNLDKEDIARILLINDLKNELGVNDEGVPIILHLVDQIHLMKKKFNDCLNKINENDI
jgi:chaperone modulatory protein CbpM